MTSPDSSVNIVNFSHSEYAAALPTVSRYLNQPLHFLHSESYGAWQEAAGKQVVYFGIYRADQLIGCGMAIQYALPAGLSYFYSPYGPLLAEWDTPVITALQRFFAVWRNQAVFVRFDAAGKSFHLPTAAAAATASLQPRNEWLLDIQPEESSLHQQIHSKARYQIRVGERNDVVVEFKPTTAEMCDQFYELLTETSDRNDFGLLPRSSYQAAFATLLKTESYVAIARINNELAAAALVYPYEGEAHYIFGCSASRFRKIGPSYLLQWKSILHAKELGCTRYNFGGISDDIKSTHLHGVTEFKKRFGGYSVSHPLPGDLILQPLRYKAFQLYKQLKRR